MKKGIILSSNYSFFRLRAKYYSLAPVLAGLTFGELVSGPFCSTFPL